MNARRKIRIHRRPGYTLIELVVVLAILAILCGIAGPRYANSASVYRGQMAAQRIAADLALAQRLGKTTSAGQAMTFNTVANSYSLPGVTGLSGGASAYNVNLAADPYQAKIISISLGGGSSITFDRYGQPSSGGTVVIQSGALQKTITIDATSGIASIQ